MPVHRIYRADSPYNAAELADMDFEQTADVLYLAHQNHKPGKLIRTGHASWAFAEVTFGPLINPPGNLGVVATKPNRDTANDGNAWFPQDSTYTVTAYNEETGQESRASSAVTVNNDLGLKRNFNTLDWDTVSGATGYRVYKSENTQLYGYIGTTTSLTFIDDNIGPDLSEGPPIGDNPFTIAGDYPGTITFHEQRSYWARTLTRPNAVYASRSADYENMDYTRPSRADDAFVIGLVANKVNSVNNLHSFKQGLLALTSHNLFSIQGSNEDYITAAPPPRVRPEVKRGASKLKPIGIDSILLYETSKLAEIRALGYEYEIDGIRSNDVTIFSRHLFDNHDVIAWDYAEKPASAVWVIRGDGKLLCLTWDEAQQVWGWTICETDGLFKGVCVITEGGEDRAYFLIERTIESVAHLYIERMASELWHELGQEYACYLDCARTFVNDTPTSEFDRLDHLEGEVVYAWVDGSKQGPFTVTDGAIALTTAGTIVTIGLPFIAEIETLPLAVQTKSGWTVARPQEAGKVIVRVVNSRNIEAGPADDDLMFEIKQRDYDDSYDPIALFTGDLEMEMPGHSGNETVVRIRSTDPTPFHIAAVMVDASFGDVS